MGHMCGPRGGLCSPGSSEVHCALQPAHCLRVPGTSKLVLIIFSARLPSGYNFGLGEAVNRETLCSLPLCSLFSPRNLKLSITLSSRPWLLEMSRLWLCPWSVASASPLSPLCLGKGPCVSVLYSVSTMSLSKQT